MNYLLRIVRFSRELWPAYAVVSAYSVLVSLMSLVQPLLTKAILDDIARISQGQAIDTATIVFYVILMFASDVGQTLFSNFGGYAGDLLSARLQRLMSERYYEHLLKLPQAYYDTELSGKIINRMNRGISQITTFAQMLSNNFLQFVFTTILSLVIVAYYSWPVAVMLLVLYPIFIWLTTRTSGKWQEYQGQINTSLDLATGRFAESIGQIRVVKSFTQEARELSFFKQHFVNVVATTKPQSRLWHKQDIMRRSVLNVIFLAVYGYIFIHTAQGHFSIGTAVLLVQYAALIRIPIFSISFLVDQSQRAVANTKDYFEAMDTEPAITDIANAQSLKVTKGRVIFENVVFSYTDDTVVINDINFELKPDSKVALVGESGEGKTTITNLLLRLYQLDSGRITIDGQDIAQVTQASLREAIGVVFQEPALFSGTIHENIAYARPDATAKEVEAAARAANAHEFISKFDKRYETEIGERGLKLSGGQKQRLAIARALLKDAPILLLDEATSSLDSRSEHLVQEALGRLMKGRTTLIIAHRLSTIAHVDEIITLRGGKVDEYGSPAQLAKTDGIYAQLLALQTGDTKVAKEKLKAYGITVGK